MAWTKPDPFAQARAALKRDDAARLRRLIARYPEVRAGLNDPSGPFGSPAVATARSRAMLDVLLEAGADINARSTWWAGGFGLLDYADAHLAAYALERGAVLTVHAASRLGMVEELRKMIEANPASVMERGGDGQTPLHFASTIEAADLLLDHGADIDARDVDHLSTPAQYMVRSRPAVARELVRRACATDLLMAAALGDGDLARRLLDKDPECIRMRVSDEYFPMVGKKNGGTIYQWELGWYVSAVQVAAAFGHRELLGLLSERCPRDEKLLNACWMHDARVVESILRESPSVAAGLPAPAARHVAHAARNGDLAAMRLMLRAGFPVTGRTQHNATALHWAAYHGNPTMVRLLLVGEPPVHDTGDEFSSPPLGWAINGSENSWLRRKGDYRRVADLLLDAGAHLPDGTGGSGPVRKALASRRSRQERQERQERR